MNWIPSDAPPEAKAIWLPEKPGPLKGLKRLNSSRHEAPLVRLVLRQPHGLSLRRQISARFVFTQVTILILLGLVLFVLALPAFAQNITDDEVNTIAQRMYCPVCENIPLDVCPTAACAEWRAEIRTQLEAGRTEEQIVADFVDRFGERVIGTPQDPTLRTLSLVTPWLVGIVALGVGIYTLYRWRSQSAGTVVSASVPSNAALLSDDEYRARLERDLQGRR